MYMSITLYLSDKRTVLVGQPPQIAHIKAPAAALIMALDHEQPNGLLLAPLSPLRAWPDSGPVAVCFLDVLGHDWHTLNRILNGTQQWYVSAIEPLFTLIRHAWQTRADANTLFRSFEQCMRDLAERHPVPFAVDERVVATLLRIRNEIDHNAPASELAQAVGLSEAHLSQCFKKQTGVALRRYRLWHRVFRTVVAVQQGTSITVAAAMAGFTDSAHFAHTFHSLFGFAPSRLFASLCQPVSRVTASQELNAELHWASYPAVHHKAK